MAQCPETLHHRTSGDHRADATGIRVLDRGRHLGALVTFEVDGWEARPFKAALDLRDVNSALSFREFAQLDFGDKGVDWAMRLSPHYYNTEEEVDLVASDIADLAGNRR